MKVGREHLAGLLVYKELCASGVGQHMAWAEALDHLIAQASAAPEQVAAAWIDPVALESAGPVYDAGFRDGCAEAKRLNAEIERLRAELAESDKCVVRALNERDAARDGLKNADLKLAEAQARLNAAYAVMDQANRSAGECQSCNERPQEDGIITHHPDCIFVATEMALSATAQPAECALSATAQPAECAHSDTAQHRTGDGTPVEFCNECGKNTHVGQPAEVKS